MGIRKRAALYVDRSVQYSLVRRVLIHWCIFFVVSLGLTFVVQFIAENPFQSPSQLVADILSRHGLVFLVLIALVPVFAFDTLRLSNRFAGPMLRFRNHMRDLADGKDVSPLRFRAGDFWKDLANDFNRMLRRVETTDEIATAGQETANEEQTLVSQ